MKPTLLHAIVGQALRDFSNLEKLLEDSPNNTLSMEQKVFKAIKDLEQTFKLYQDFEAFRREQTT